MRIVHSWTSDYRVGSAVYLSSEGTLLRSERPGMIRGTFARGGGVISEYNTKKYGPNAVSKLLSAAKVDSLWLVVI